MTIYRGWKYKFSLLLESQAYVQVNVPNSSPL